MSFAYGTLTAVPDGTSEIQNFMVGDLVLAGSPSGGSGLEWKPANVKFSAGEGAGSRQPAMVYIGFGEDATIICTANQYFLLPGGKIKRADRLIPGRDTLTDADGKPVKISQINIGVYTGGVHDIATDAEFNGSLDNHLLITVGVVTGDYYVEIHGEDLREKGLIED